ncbi:alanine--tRNA ligase [Lentisalinibacter orientalis]|uniref:alanine--tRNA ligase n=1 Tax=Lentisalinibacter orientalis TaxID=2992241 RepID=UPI003870B4A7
MKSMTSSELRTAFLEFFADEGHEVVPSSPLVPANDPTLLFTNAGMVQFKDVFLGREQRDYVRAVSSQRCVRAGGKHNDLENVGYTARHLTFFEMLGNFSFGDYFKREAIDFAWRLVTGKLGIPPEKLWVTVYQDDDEAADIWLNEIGVDPERFSRLGEKDNFWAMGDTGPCGPCSEIFFDHGPEVAGGPPGSPDEDGDRYVEVWNLVFMQYDRAADGTMTELPAPSVDTGMGLERISAVMQGVHSVYEIDLFANLIEAIAKIMGVPNDGSSSLNVIADHIRSCAFLITDRVDPSNEGRGYVLRRIIRRALRHGYKLGVTEPFFHKLVQPLAAGMGEAYPELVRRHAHVEKVLKREEERFAETLEQGMAILEESIAGLDGEVIPGDVVFRLYDTYGFPVDLTADIARERGLSIDQPGFEAAMEGQRERARAASKFGAAEGEGVALDAESRFSGYERDSGESEVIALVKGGESVTELAAGDEGGVVLADTPFYAESGGQVGDTGVLSAGGVTFRVTDTRKSGGAHVHYGKLEAGTLKIGDSVSAEVDAERRNRTRLNHSATHLLHAALREVLGDHVTQKGSLVAPDRLRFDFSHYDPVTPEELQRIEDLVNREIRRNVAAETREMAYDDAIAAGAVALFGEKYEDEVRVLRLGDFSMELCGGTHVSRTGDIGLFKITGEGGVAAGVRRIEAVTGEKALAWVRAEEEALAQIAELVRGSRDDAASKVGQVIQRNRALEKEVADLKRKLATGGGSTDLTAGAETVGDLKVLAVRIDGADPATLRDTVDQLKDKLGRGVVVVGSADGDKVRLAAGVTKDATDRVKAGDLVRTIAEQVGGKGGGRPDFAQAGGNDPAALDAALAGVRDWVAERIS